MNKIVLLLSICLSPIIFAQQSEIIKLKNFRIGILNDSIQETSGLCLFDEKLYTFNDSGNPANLFEIDKKSGKILKNYPTNLANIDWEALTTDGNSFYIGDFGNGAGTRKDLTIYKIPFRNNQLIQDSAITISFHYPNQTEFISKNLNTDFDAEAMIYLHGKIHIFTKEWYSKSTTHYILDPDSKEDQAAQKVESYPTGFMISDACYFNEKLYVVGYTKKTEVFLTVFTESNEGIFFQNKPKQFYLGSALSVGQIEGISVDESGIYISSEKFHTPINKPRPYFYFIPKDKLKL